VGGRDAESSACVVFDCKGSALGVDRGFRCFGLHFVWAGHLLDGRRCDQLGHADEWAAFLMASVLIWSID
jgi:hypothetical protein